MSFLGKLFGIGVTAAATVAAVRVADKYNENKANGEVNENGDVVADITKAATEVYNETSEKVKDFAQDMKKKAGELADQAPEFVDKVKNEIKDAVDSAVPADSQDVTAASEDSAE